MSSDIDPNKLKVTELRDELKNRGLDTKGVKAVLVKRLKQALNEERGIVDTGEGDVDDSQLDESGGADDSQDAAEESQADGGDVAFEGQDQEGIDFQVVAATEGEGAEEGEGEAEAGGEENGEAGEGQGEEEIEMPDELGDEYKTIDETKDDDDERGGKRKRSRSRERHRGRRSRSRERRRSRSPPIRKVDMEDSSWESGTTFLLDRYNSDLNLRIQDDGLKANPLTVEGFAFMWAGVRSMFGVKSGKVAYEVKLVENLNVDHLPSDETSPHVLRVGWSVDDSSLQLGEEPLSYGYGGTGKASTDCKFVDYGETFTAGDVITAYLDMDSDPAVISYAKNGNDLGVCFEVPKEQLQDKALFAHLLTKNTEFECNFGLKEEPYFPLKEGYVFLESVAQEERVRGALPPAQKEDCEIIMMVGLPGAGKTYWMEKHSAANVEKKYFLLGTNNIIDKMKVMGLPRKMNYSGRWDVLIDKSTKCLNRMIEIAARKKRNYILDQTNVYPSARRRKMQPFEGFQRKAVVIIPTDEEFKRRCEKRDKEEGKDVPEKAVLEMKANFTLPEVGQLFDSLEFPEEADLSKEDAEKLVEKYKKEARDLLPPPEKRFRDSRYSDRGRRDFRDYRPRGGYRGFDKDRYRGGHRGGFRDDRRGGFSPRGSDRSRGKYDSRSRFDDRRSYGSGGGYRYGGGYQGQRSGSSYYGGGGGGGGGGGSGGSNYKGWGNQGSWGHQGGWGGNQSNPGYRGYGSSSWNQGGSGWGGQGGNYWGGSGYGGSGYGGSGGSGYSGSSSWGSGYGGSGSYGSYR